MSDEPREGEMSTLQRPRFDAPPAKLAFVLDVVEGPDRGARFLLDESTPGPVLLGTSPACAFRLSDREASRRHASFDIEDQRLRVTDLRSTNGTLLDGTAILDAYVRSGQSLRVGATTLKASRAASPAPGPSATSPAESFGRILGASFEMRRLYPLFEQLAASSLSLIVEGETGTGKELLAETLHDVGPRRGGPFVVFDCTTVPAGQLEIELFGHEAGAFPGAQVARRGLFEEANNGTLYLDEIAGLDPDLQPKLLRAIERSEVTPVGSRVARRVDVRIIGATQVDLDHAVQVGRLREDLYHRLVVARVALPALRKRRGDIEILATHFAGALGGGPLPAMLLSRWRDYSWPGNVRELRNAVARFVAFGEAGELMTPSSQAPAVLGADVTVRDFVESALAGDMPLTRARQEIVHVYDRLYVERVLAKHGGNVTRAAAAAGVERRYFQVLRARGKSER
jgi:DNA-binding NtrC family response regulator